MKAIIQIVIETEVGRQMQEVTCLERKEHCLEKHRPDASREQRPPIGCSKNPD
jgi:hypothetical protein